MATHFGVPQLGAYFLQQVMLESNNTWIDKTHSDDFVNFCVIVMTRSKMAMLIM